VLNNLAWMYLGRDPRRALEYAERAYDLQPDRPEVADTYGWVLVQQGRVAEGLRVIKQAAVLAPHVPDIRYHLAVALYRTGQPGEARKELERLLRSGADFPDVEEARTLLQEIQAAG